MGKGRGRTPWLGNVSVSNVRSINYHETAHHRPGLFLPHRFQQSLTRCTLPGPELPTHPFCSLSFIPSLLFHRPFPFTILGRAPELAKLAMDALVAQYSRPAFEDEGYSSEDQQELTKVTPPLSLKFALPPIAQVCLFTCSQAPKDLV